MSTRALLTYLADRDIHLRRVGNQIEFDAPQGTLSDELVEVVGLFRGELLQVLEPRPKAGGHYAAFSRFSVGQLRADLEDRYADHPKRDEILDQFEVLRRVSLPARYANAPRPLTQEEFAWQAAYEINGIYGPLPTAPAPRKGP